MKKITPSAIYSPVWIKLIIALLLLTPSIRIMQGVPMIRLELIVALVYMFLLLLIMRSYFAWGTRQILLAGFAGIFVISYYVGGYLGFDSSVSDFNQLIRIIKYVSVYTISLTIIQLANNSEEIKIDILKYTALVSLFLSLLVVIQQFDIFDLNKYYLPYIDSIRYNKYIEGVYGMYRPVGMIGNPNDLGFIFCILSLITVFLLGSGRVSKFYIIVLIIQLSTIGFSLSRSSIVAFVVGLTVLLTVKLLKGARGVKSVASYIIIFTILGIFVYYAISSEKIYEMIIWRFEELAEIEESTSWTNRLENWNENLGFFYNSPLFGVGPLRSGSFEHAADNEWILLLRSYGVVGTLYFILIFLVPEIKNRLIAFRSRTYSDINFNELSFAVLLACIVYMIPAGVYHSLLVMPFILIILSFSDISNRIYRIR